MVYSLQDQLGENFPDDICKGLKAYESFTVHLWGGIPDLGNPTLVINRLTDTFSPALLQGTPNVDGIGHQIITIDHMKKEHDILIHCDEYKPVEYSNEKYFYNQ